MEPRKVYRPVVAGSHHFDEEQDSDLHKSEKLDPDLDPFERENKAGSNRRNFNKQVPYTYSLIRSLQLNRNIAFFYLPGSVS